MAGIVVLCAATQSIGGPICRPDLSLKQAQVSAVSNLQRTWTATVAVDASRCSAGSGQFRIEYTRLKESAPDLVFSERFEWRPRLVEVSLDFWWDEWPQDYRIVDIAPCSCRD